MEPRKKRNRIFAGADSGRPEIAVFFRKRLAIEGEKCYNKNDSQKERPGLTLREEFWKIGIGGSF